ncbi:DMT family transporter [Paenibacillus sp. GCM10027626]|uniref:DMT family transporter n=1 Tax=Paenibacillus sp. GCM10027626 TaxID=3273411 RepID=UPI00362870F0
MVAYLLLAGAIAAEVCASTMLKLTKGFTVKLPIIGMIFGYGISFYMLSLALFKLPLGLSYAVWSGVGTVLTAVVGMVLFKEKINRKGFVGIGLLLTGVVLLNLTD